MEEIIKYECAICGKRYPSVQERMNCEMKCLKKKQEEEKKAAEEKKKAEKDTRKKEVDEAFENFAKLYDTYGKDYGYYPLNYNVEKEIIVSNTPTEYTSPWSNKLWHNFWY